MIFAYRSWTYMKKAKALVWFRNDLRLTDNPALFNALSACSYIVPIFIYTPEEECAWPPGAASLWWLHYSLTELTASLAKTGTKLIIRKGLAAKTLSKMAQDIGAEAVFYNRRYEPWAREQEQQVDDELNKENIEINSYNANLLFTPEQILNKSETPFKVFTPYWNKLSSLPPPEKPLPKPRSINKLATAIKLSKIKSLEVKDLKLLPNIDWARGIRETWQPGEKGAQAALREFIATGLANYSQGRDRPALSAVSRLSPYLHFGEISPRTIWHAIKQHSLFETKISSASDHYLRELAWREFAHYLLYYFPQTTDKPLRPEFNKFPWSNNKKYLNAWRRGLTGYPIVDAGMRELWHTGWMHNRVRMIVASFLVKDLLISWQEGAKWFWDTLVDADLANNTLGWQWTAGCGADAAPYFRIFNPVLQGEKFDPDGTYVRHWIPELKNISSKWIHSPWLAPAEQLTAAGIKLGINYPYPIVDHHLARQRSLSAFAGIKLPKSTK